MRHLDLELNDLMPDLLALGSLSSELRTAKTFDDSTTFSLSDQAEGHKRTNHLLTRASLPLIEEFTNLE